MPPRLLLRSRSPVQPLLCDRRLPRLHFNYTKIERVRDLCGGILNAALGRLERLILDRCLPRSRSCQQATTRRRK